MSFEVDFGHAFLWSVFSTAVLTLIMGLSQGFGITRISLPYMIGSAFSSRRSIAMTSGMIAHFLIGTLFALGYTVVFDIFGVATWWFGAGLGILHSLFVLAVFMPAFPAIHPRMAGKHHGPSPTRQLEPPGFFALNYGILTPYITILAHVVYGALIGVFYEVSAL